MAVAVLKTLVRSQKGAIPESITLESVWLPSGVVYPSKSMVFYYGTTDAAQIIAEQARSFMADGYDVSIVEVSIDIGDTHADFYQKPRVHDTTLVRLNRLNLALREELQAYFRKKINANDKMSEAYSWNPPKLISSRLDILESAAKTLILKPCEVMTFWVPREGGDPISVGMLMSSDKVTTIRVFGPHQKTEIKFPKKF